MKIALIILLACIVTLPIAAQQPMTVTADPPAAAANALAKEAYEAHGGAKLGAMKSLSMSGKVDITSSAANQAIPATFVQIFSGEKYRLEVDGGFIQFVQTFDGVNTVTSPSRGFELPPINRVGLALLQRLGNEGFEVSEAGNPKNKGFRITSPEGFFTDFYVNKKTKRIKSYEASYMAAGREVISLVEIDKFAEQDGVVIPSKFAQKFEVSGMTIYALFKAKEIVVNEAVSDELFAAGK